MRSFEREEAPKCFGRLKLYLRNPSSDFRRERKSSQKFCVTLELDQVSSTRAAPFTPSKESEDKDLDSEIAAEKGAKIDKEILGSSAMISFSRTQ